MYSALLSYAPDREWFQTPYNFCRFSVYAQLWSEYAQLSLKYAQLAKSTPKEPIR